MFFVIQLAAMVRSNSGNMVIAQTLGSSAVTQYAVPVRVLLIVGTLITIMLTPIWPAYSEAIARGDVDWVRATLQRTTALSLIFTVPFGVLLIMFGRIIIFHWTGGRVVPSMTLLVALAIWGIISGVWACFAVFLMAAAIRFHACTAVIASVLNLFLSIYFTRRIGISGAVLGSIIGESVAVIPAIVYVPRLLGSFRAAHRQ
jgi:O-antigen/teichoic acid export membrane protein